MPRSLRIEPYFEALLDAQDRVVSRRQAQAAGLNNDAIAHRVAFNGWQQLLPNVFLTHAGEPARRQRLVAAQLWAGPDAAIDGCDACRFHGLKSVAIDDASVHVAIPADGTRRSTSFVRVRRSAELSALVHSAFLRYVDPATAVIAATRDMASPRSVLAAMSEAVQRRLCTPQQLMRAHLTVTRRNATLADDAIAAILGGVQSAPEADFRKWAEVSCVLPPLLYNALLLMPDGRRISPDALAPDAPLIHETNGRVAHERDDLFEDMQTRHDYLTTWGFTVLHNPPRRLRARGREAIGEFERCYVRLRGTGLPPGVVLLRPASAATTT